MTIKIQGIISGITLILKSSRILNNIKYFFSDLYLYYRTLNEIIIGFESDAAYVFKVLMVRCSNI